MRIFVISLRTQVERRQAMRTQLERLNLRFTFFDAIDMRQTKTKYFRALDLHQFQLNTGRFPLTNEVGCFASHLTLWRTCITLGEPIIILEDDACVEDGFSDAILFLERKGGDLGFVSLEENRLRLGCAEARSRSFALHYCPKYSRRAMAYAIAPTAAHRFVEASRYLTAPVDRFIEEVWVHKQPLYQLSPHVVSAGEIAMNSTTIGLRRRLRCRRLSSRCERALYNGRNNVRRVLFNLIYRARKLGALRQSKCLPGSSHVSVAGRGGSR